VARRIAALAQGNFLIAGLIARSHGLHDHTPATAAEITFPASVGAALTIYLQRIPGAGTVPATDLLTALAYAEAPGLPGSLGTRTPAQLAMLCRCTTPRQH
jgi:hypothetical protein